MTDPTLLQNIAGNPVYLSAASLGGVMVANGFNYLLAMGDAFIKERKGSHLERLLSSSELRGIERKIQTDLHTKKKISNINEQSLLSYASCITKWDGYLNIIDLDLEGTAAKLIQKFSNNKEDLRHGIRTQRYLSEVRNLDFVPRSLSGDSDLGNISYFIPSEKREKKIYEEDRATKKAILERITEDFFIINEPVFQKETLPAFLEDKHASYFDGNQAVIEGSTMVPCTLTGSKGREMTTEVPDLNIKAYDLWSFIKFGTRKSFEFEKRKSSESDMQTLTTLDFIPHTSKSRTMLDNALKFIAYPLSPYLLRKIHGKSKAESDQAAPGSTTPELQDFLKSYCTVFGESGELDKKFGKFISHGDPNSNNILYDGKKVHILDWDKSRLNNFYRDIYGFARSIGLQGDQSFRELVRKRFSEKGYAVSEVEKMQKQIEIEEDLKYGFQVYHATKHAQGEEKAKFENFASYYVTRAARKLNEMGAADVESKLAKLVNKRYGSMSILNDSEMNNLSNQRIDETLYENHLGEYFSRKNPELFTEGAVNRRKETHNNYLLAKELFNHNNWSTRYAASPLIIASGILGYSLYSMGAENAMRELATIPWSDGLKFVGQCGILAGAAFGFKGLRNFSKKRGSKYEDRLIGHK